MSNEIITGAKLRELAKLEAKATKGPWSSSREDMDSFVEFKDELVPVAYVYRGEEERVGFIGEQFRNDSRFVKSLRNAAPALLETIKQLREALAEMVEHHLRRDEESVAECEDLATATEETHGDTFADCQCASRSRALLARLEEKPGE